MNRIDALSDLQFLAALTLPAASFIAGVLLYAPTALGLVS